MTAHVLINGTIFRAPESRVSKAGKPFWTATIKAKGDDATAWWKIIVFSDSAGAELMRLSDGDALAAQGSLRVETYERDGLTKISLTCIADTVLPLRAAPKQREKKDPAPAPAPSEKPAPERSSLDRHGDSGDDRFNDQVPF
jgi:single-stranded DNA-binding protein